MPSNSGLTELERRGVGKLGAQGGIGVWSGIEQELDAGCVGCPERLP